MALWQRGTTFEQQARTVRLQPVEQRIQRPADPEILFDILHRRAEPPRGSEEAIAPVSCRLSEKAIEIRIHVSTLCLSCLGWRGLLGA